MSRQDVENFQSFVRKYVNRAVKEHFRDIDGNDDASLSLDVPRQAIKRVCLHKDTDPIVLTVGRMLIWWVEAKGLFDEYIYGIPSTDFEISNTYYPQVKLHFKEDKYIAATSERKPIRGEVSFRWRETDYTTANIRAIANKVYADFVQPVFYYQRGRELWSYADKSKGDYFQMTVDSEATAKKVIEQVIRVQEEREPDWDKYLRKHEDKRNYTTQETIRVMGEVVKKPKKRPVGRVEFQYAELFIPGMTKPIILVDHTGNKINAIRSSWQTARP